MSGKEMGKIAEDALGRTGFGGAPPEAARQLSLYLQEVDFWNGKMHLVGRGRLGSSAGASRVRLPRAAERRGGKRDRRGRVADIGSGAGFPGLVWKIVRPRLDLTLFDRRLKPQLFLDRVVAQLGLKGITVIRRGCRELQRERARSISSYRKPRGGSRAFFRLRTGFSPREERTLPSKAGPGRARCRKALQSSLRLESVVELPEERGSAVVFRKSQPA